MLWNVDPLIYFELDIKKNDAPKSIIFFRKTYCLYPGGWNENDQKGKPEALNKTQRVLFNFTYY